jgi:hypothetical protein
MLARVAEDIRDLQRPGKTFVVRGEAALESRHRRLNAFGGGTQLPAQLGQPIGANVALDQPPADALLKFCELWRLDRESGRRGGLCQALRWRAVAEGQLAVILKTSRRPEPVVQDMAVTIQKFPRW